MSRTVIRGGCVLTLDAKVGNHRQADVLIENGRIAEVGSGLRARDADVLDASQAIVMPGFVDAHRHVWKSLFRNQGAGETPVADPGPDDVYAATLVGLLGAAEAGITTVVDWADVPADALPAVLQAHTDAGLRTVLVRPDPTTAASDLTTLAFASPDATRANATDLGQRWEDARKGGLRIHVHAGLSDDDHGVLAGAGLGDDVTVVHGTRLSDADLDAAAAAGSPVVLAPSTEMAGPLGRPPIQQLLDRKIRLGLAVDDEQLAPGDLFAQMRAAISVQHATYFDLKLAGKAGLPNLLTTREMIRYATLEGAQAIGLGATIGSLTPGKAADVIVLRTDRPNIFPINDPIGAVVWGMDTSNIEAVFVGGDALVRDGKLTGDVERARGLAEAARSRLQVGAASGSDPR